MANNLETAARIAADSIREDVVWYGSDLVETGTWPALMDLFGVDGREMKENVRFALRSYYTETGKWSITDDCEVVEDDGTVKGYRQLVNAIKKQLWNNLG